ncbi:MAG: Protease 4 [Candidatus Celerinatantimonas neptuna]|nr:MAG: Protease 4 [Candidatus Celerinatantimonas neptuna]
MKFILKLIGRIVKGIWRSITFIRQFILNIIFLGLIIAIIVVVHRGEEKVPSPLKTPSALQLNLDGRLVEESQSPNYITHLVQRTIGEKFPNKIDIHELVHTIHQAKTDNHITGLVLNLGKLQRSGLAKLQTIAQAITDFKKSGKPVIAVADSYDQGQYYLASFANQILLNPAGSVDIKGFSANQLFYKDALHKLGIQTHVFRVGIYKSFVEPYIRNGMSKPARQDLTRWVNQLWQDYTSDVAHNRRLTPAEIAPSGPNLIAKLRQVDGNEAQYALKNKLVDHLFTRDQVHHYLIHLFGKEKSGNYRHISLKSYQDLRPSLYQNSDTNSPQIAVVIARGPIVNGTTRNDNNVIAADSLIKTLDKVQHNKQIKALVLRVDSPGGSAFAAELIRTKLAAIQKVGKPVIISMGATAASGGYWISSTSNRIFAAPTTITGSIGIFGMFATAENGLNKLGVHSDGVTTTDYATISPLSPLPKDVAQILQLNVENGYHRFVSLVQKGRHYASYAQVDKLAQGRIWTGREAKANGLVDQLGNMKDAIHYAAKLVKLHHYDLIRLNNDDSSSSISFRSLFNSQIGHWLSTEIPWLSQIRTLSGQLQPHMLTQDPQHLFAYCKLCHARI